MEMPTRIQVRTWLAYESREWVNAKLEEFTAMQQADLRHILNCEHRMYREGVPDVKSEKNRDYFLVTEGEQSLLSDHSRGAA